MARHPVYLSVIGAGCALVLTPVLAGCGMSGSASTQAPSVYASLEKAGPPAPPSLAAKGADIHPADAAWADHEDTSVAVNLPPVAPSVSPPGAPAAVPVTPVAVSDAPPPAVVADMNRRMEKLEKEVADMHNDMNMMMPALTKLVSAQQDLQQLLARMDTAAGTPAARIADTHADSAAMPDNPKTLGPPAKTEASAAPQPLPGGDAASLSSSSKPTPLSHDDVPPPSLAGDPVAPAMPEAQAAAAPAPVSAPASTAVPPQPAVPSPYAVNQIRFGEHNHMTRIVLDASGKVPYTYALDASGTLMTMHLPQTDWKTAASAAPAGSKVVDSYTVTPDGQGGYMLAVRLREPVSVSWADMLAPSADGGYRVVFDLTPKA